MWWKRGGGVLGKRLDRGYRYVLNSWLVMVEDYPFGLMYGTMDFCFSGI